MFNGIITKIKDKIKVLEYDDIFVGEKNWSETLKMNTPMIEILPASANRKQEGFGNFNVDNWKVAITIARKGLEFKAEDLEVANLDDLHTLISGKKIEDEDIAGLHNYSFTESTKRVLITVDGYDATRVLVDGETGQGMYIVAAIIELNVKIMNA